MSRVVRDAFPDRQFDVDFRQQQGDEAIFEALRVLNQHKVAYLIVGAYAVMKYPEPLYTRDMDIWVDPGPENAQRAYKSLAQFGAPLGDLTVADRRQPGTFFRSASPPRGSIS